MANYRKYLKMAIPLLIVVNVLIVMRTTRAWRQSNFKYARELDENPSTSEFHEDGGFNSLPDRPPPRPAATNDVMNNFEVVKPKEEPSQAQINTAGEGGKPSATAEQKTSFHKDAPNNLDVTSKGSGKPIGNKVVEELKDKGIKEGPLPGNTISRAGPTLGKNAGADLSLHRYHGGFHIPAAIIIGGAMCGTHQLATFLSLHPRIFIPDGLINFFNDETNYSKGLRWYGARMPKNVPANGVIVERGPGYFDNEDAPKRIHAMKASIKLILMIRNPVRRTVSEYAHYLARARLTNKRVPRFEQMMVEPESKLINAEQTAVFRSIYHVHLSRWLRYFSKEQILVLNGDNFIRNPFAELKKAEEFLDLPHLITEDKLYFNSTSGHFCAIRNGKPDCYNRMSTWTNVGIDQNVLDKMKLYYNHHNAKLYSLIGDRYEW